MRRGGYKRNMNTNSMMQDAYGEGHL
jgi:hypothetical protein